MHTTPVATDILTYGYTIASIACNGYEQEKYIKMKR
jgi:hypothetical protein